MYRNTEPLNKLQEFDKSLILSQLSSLKQEQIDESLRKEDYKIIDF